MKAQEAQKSQFHESMVEPSQVHQIVQQKLSWSSLGAMASYIRHFHLETK